MLSRLGKLVVETLQMVKIGSSKTLPSCSKTVDYKRQDQLRNGRRSIDDAERDLEWVN